MIVTRFTKTYLLLAMACLLLMGGPGGCRHSPEQMVPMISKEQLKTKLGATDMILIDLFKPKVDSGRRRITGAIKERPADHKLWAGKYDKNKMLVLYCSCGDDEASVRIGKELLKMGFKEVFALKGGWHEWSQAGYPTEP